MHKAGDNTSSVWPAYVAVMACLIQIMMLLVVVLATGVMTMNSQTSSLKAAIAQLFLDQRLQTQAEMAAAERQGADKNEDTAVQQSQLSAVSMIVFQADALKLDAPARQNLVAFVKEHAQKRESEWEVVAQGKLAISTERRAAFLRLLEVRQVMLEVGVQEARIQTKIEQETSLQTQGSEGSNTVFIYVRQRTATVQPPQ